MMTHLAAPPIINTFRILRPHRKAVKKTAEAILARYGLWGGQYGGLGVVLGGAEGHRGYQASSAGVTGV